MLFYCLVNARLVYTKVPRPGMIAPTVKITILRYGDCQNCGEIGAGGGGRAADRRGLGVSSPRVPPTLPLPRPISANYPPLTPNCDAALNRGKFHALSNFPQHY
ncbi:hypothetical protein J6590_098059 [Homalodisca vitripennis]|nr:hypothetical protein J6590_075798 [Homalodisca vitripennis]KAG8274881.1 hypothetical protein J6590_098059 [Homalodisca vitripennis]